MEIHFPQQEIHEAIPKQPTDSSLPAILDTCKIALNNAVDQFHVLQEKVMLFSHNMKQPFDTATGNKIDQYLLQLIIIMAKLEKFSHPTGKHFKYPAMREELDAKNSSIGGLMVACPNYMLTARLDLNSDILCKVGIFRVKKYNELLNWG